MLHDAASRTQHQIDIVDTGRNPNGSTTVLAIGETKYTGAKRNLADLHRLEHIRTLLTSKHPSAATARLLLFAGHGFDQRLTNEADQRNDIELIDLERLYTGT